MKTVIAAIITLAIFQACADRVPTFGVDRHAQIEAAVEVATK